MSDSRPVTDRCGPEVPAAISGVCKMCETNVVAGEHYVRKSPSKGWIHADCAREYERLRDLWYEENGEQN
jgi:hypothetical protein